jgi:ATP-dependent Clp endopeptidase proteolytic subunit ClpP
MLRTPVNRLRNSKLRNFQRPKNALAGRWYEIKNSSAANVEISVYDEIGYWGVSAADFVNDLNSVSAKNITLRINSPGGDVQDGLAMLNALRQHPANIHVIVDGWAASAASFIAMAGDRVSMAPNAMLMIHDAAGMCMGNAQDMQEMADLLDKHSDNIASVYQRRAGGTVEDWREAMRAETWYSDQEAVDAGLADEILGEDVEEEPVVAALHASAQTVVNSDVSSEAQVDNVIDSPDLNRETEPTAESPEAFDFAAFRAAMTAVKEATRG